MGVVHETAESLFSENLEVCYPEAMECYSYFADYFANNGLGFPAPGANYRYLPGRLPILLSAPHATRQVRNGALKHSDVMTGCIADYLNQHAGYQALVRFYCDNDDPNADLTGPGMEYKEYAAKLVHKHGIKLFLDLHGCTEREEYDFCIGVNGGKNLCGHSEALEQLIQLLEPLGKVAIDQRFKASLPTNVSRYVAEQTGIPCIQLEIGRRFRVEYEPLGKLLKQFQQEAERLIK